MFAHAVYRQFSPMSLTSPMGGAMNKLIGVLALGLAACGGGNGDASAADAAVPAKSTSATKVPTGNSPVSVAKIISSNRTLARGTAIEVTINSGITSRHNNAGDQIDATVSQDVRDDKGHVVIRAGSPVSMRIAVISASHAGHAQGDEGELELNVTAIVVDGERKTENMSTRDVPHTMKGRGVTKGQGEDIAVGAAVGALAGQLIGKNTKSTVIGGAVGAVGGGAVAVAGAQRDIVVEPGTRVTFTLSQSMTVVGK